MKIKCDKCGKDITILCDANIESYQVGKIKCPDCNTTQKRYISEADVLLFFGMNEILYTVFTFLSIKLFEIEFAWWVIAIMLAMFVAYYFLSKEIATYIYVNAPFKKDIKNMSFVEDKKKIQKSLTWQFMLFFTIAITGLTLESSARIYFLIILPIIPLISFIKFYFQARYENRLQK